MSTETYKAILKISVILISSSLFSNNLNHFLSLYEALIEHLDTIDIMTQKLYLQDNKITYNSIKLVTDLINRALEFNYSGIITLAGRLKHVTFFSTVGNLIETDDKIILNAIEHLKVAYYNLNEKLNATSFDMNVQSHKVMMKNLFIFLDVSLNEYGVPATKEEFVKAGFTEDPQRFVAENFTILLAMDLKIFLKDPNLTFKKKFHEELMMSDHGRTFPISLFIERCTEIWLEVFHAKAKFSKINELILSWELMIYNSMTNCLMLWEETRANLENSTDVDKILQLIKSNIEQLEIELNRGDKTVEECIEFSTTKTGEEMRHNQVMKLNDVHSTRWSSRFAEFDRDLSKDVFDFVSEQRVIQLLKGSWVYTDTYGEQMLNKKSGGGYKYYFISLSPNRKQIYYKEHNEKGKIPSYEELEHQYVKLSDIANLKSTKIDNGEEDKKSSMLVAVKGTISYEKITIFGKGGQVLLSFYTDNKVNNYVWLDGIKMLKGLGDELSNDTSKQIESLMNIRRTTQLLALEHKIIAEHNLEEYEDEEDREYYDLSELLDVTTDFHYK